MVIFQHLLELLMIQSDKLAYLTDLTAHNEEREAFRVSGGLNSYARINYRLLRSQ